MKGISFLFFLISCAAPYQPKYKDPIKATFHTKDFVYRQCYHESDSYRGMHVDEKRKLDVNFQIGTDGKVSKAQVLKSDFTDANLHACVLNYVRNLRFENISNVMTTTQTINFGHSQL